MTINPTFTDISFENIGVRNSQKRLKQLINDLAVEPLKDHSQELMHKFHQVEEILARRIALVIIYWLQHKHNPMKPASSDMMSDITNATHNDMTLNQFYHDQVRDGMHQLAPLFGLEMPYPYEVETEELEYALIELEERFKRSGGLPGERHTDDSGEPLNAYSSQFGYDDDFSEAYYDEYDDYSDNQQNAYDDMLDNVYAANAPQDDSGSSFNMDSFFGRDEGDDEFDALNDMDNIEGFESLAGVIEDDTSPAESEDTMQQTLQQQAASDDRALVLQQQQNNTQIEKIPEQTINIDMLNLSADRAWEMTYNLMGYRSEYIQNQLLPRWQSNPTTFEKDRRFLYNTFIETIRSAAGAQAIAGNYRFSDRDMTVDDLWNHYYTDLAQHVGPQLATARLEAKVNTPGWKRLWQRAISELKKLSPVWILALVIALVFDGLTTYVSLDQTPMEGFMVMVFTLLITALFQIADLLVISYRKREFEADAMGAKYRARYEKFENTLNGLNTVSDSYVQVSMQKSQAEADWKAADDSRRMARRGRFWSARIADINIVVTAYGFAYMFLNASEPMYALFQQIDIIQRNAWSELNLWVFLMIGLAITVSFVINTAQRTEILGWSMRRLKNDT